MILTIPGRRPTTVNASRRMHPHQRAADDKWWRDMAWARSLELRDVGARFDRLASVTATPLYRDRRSLSDPGGVYPSVKAALDGIVDAGVLAGDTGEHVAWIKLCAPRVCGIEGLELVIEVA